MSSSSKTPSSRHSKRNLRVSELDESDILPPPLVSPEKESVPSSSHAKRRSSQSYRKASPKRTPEVDSPSLTYPGSLSVSERRRSSKSSRRLSKTPESNQRSTRKLRLSDLEQSEVRVPDTLLDTNEGAEHTINRTRGAQQGAGAEDLLGLNAQGLQPSNSFLHAAAQRESIVTTIPERDQEKKKRRRAIAAIFICCLIAAGVAAWILLKKGHVIPEESSKTGDLPKEEIPPVSEQLSSSSPSSSPSTEDDDNSLYREICSAIGNGTAIFDEEGLAPKEYDVLIDAVLESDDQLESLADVLAERIQSVLMPALVGCTDDGGKIDNGIVNALVTIEDLQGGECGTQSDETCQPFVIHLDLDVKRIVSSGDFGDLILEEFQKSPLVERLGLDSPFTGIIVLRVFDDSSTSPSGKFIDGHHLRITNFQLVLECLLCT